MASPAADDGRAARLGQAVHRVLEWAAATPVRADLDRLAAAACAEFGVTELAPVRVAAARILGSTSCAAFFDPRALTWAGNEVTVAGVGAEVGQLLRIDRLVLTAGDAPTWWVLDYKLVGRPQEDAAYLGQLAAYRRAVQALQPGKPVRAAFISGIGELIEPA
jgi:ATP-dependent helicase/nuclease subunit A